MINFFSDNFFYNNNKSIIYKKFDKIIKSNYFTNSEEVRKLEINLGKLFNKKYCIAVSSGTAALHLSLVSLGIKKNDEIITPAFSFLATPMSISYLGAKPIFVDIEKTSWNIDPLEIEKKITPNTKLILPVHMHGLMSNMHAISRIAKKHKLNILEDASQAAGSLYKSKPPGYFSKIATLSFYPTKNLGTYGEGGAILTNDKNIYDECVSLRNWGHNRKLSFNYRMSEFSACILNLKIKDFKTSINSRNKISKIYLKNLLLKNNSITQFDKKKFFHSYHIFGLLINNRNKIISESHKYGVEFKSHYPYYLPNLRLFKEYQCVKNYKNAKIISENILSLPIYPEMKKNDILKIIKIINNIIKKQ